MIHEWERQYPGRIDNMATAMGNITLSHLMDRQLFPFTTRRATRPRMTTPAPAAPQPIGGSGPAPD
jgi:hypothetical protein